MRFTKCLVVVVLITAVSCKRSPENVFRARAHELRQRVMPVGSTASEPAVTRSGAAISAAWDIHTDLKRDALESWLPEALNPDFTKTIAEGDRLCFAKYDAGESNRLEFTFSEAEGHTIAHVRLIIAPD